MPWLLRGQILIAMCTVSSQPQTATLRPWTANCEMHTTAGGVKIDTIMDAEWLAQVASGKRLVIIDTLRRVMVGLGLSIWLVRQFLPVYVGDFKLLPCTSN